MAFQGPGIRLNPLSTSLIQSSDHYKVSVIIIPILQMKFKAIEVNNYTAESSALALHNSYKWTNTKYISVHDDGYTRDTETFIFYQSYE